MSVVCVRLPIQTKERYMEFPLLDPLLVKKELGIDEDRHKLSPTVFAMTKKGPALIMDEGVGWMFDEDNESTLVFYEAFGDSAKTITLEQAKRCISENTIDLETLIGTYNDRYRNNLDLWTGMTKDVPQNVLA
jgi:hypothetical protein